MLLAFGKLRPVAALLVYIFVIHGSVIHTGEAYILFQYSQLNQQSGTRARCGLMTTTAAAKWNGASNADEGRGRPALVGTSAATGKAMLARPKARKRASFLLASIVLVREVWGW